MANRIYTFDLLKFIFALIIAIFHLSWKYAPEGYLCVELFFCLSGFLMFLKRDKYRDKDVILIWLHRVFSYYGYYLLFSIIYFVCFMPDISAAQVLKSALFFQFLGLSKPVIFITLWFLGVYTYVYLLYLLLIKHVFINQLLAILPFFLYFLYVNMYSLSTNQSIMWTFEDDYRLWGIPFFVMRGITGIGIGFCIGSLTMIEFRLPFASWIILGLLSFVLYIVLLSGSPQYDYLICLVSGLLYVCIAKFPNSSILRGLEMLGNKFKGIFSLYLPIYVFHPVVIELIKRYYSTQNTPPRNISYNSCVVCSTYEEVLCRDISSNSKIKGAYL